MSASEVKCLKHVLRTIIKGIVPSGFLLQTAVCPYLVLLLCQYVLFMICGVAAKVGRKPCSPEHRRGKKIYFEAQTTNYNITFIQSSDV